MRLIKLHENEISDKTEIFINVNNIVFFKESISDSGTTIMLTTGDIIWVQETVNQLIDKLQFAQKYQTLIT